MGTATKPTRENRTITVDFRDEATYFCLIADGKAFLEFVFAFLLSLGFQLKHKATCHGGGRLTRHSHYARIGFDHGAGHPRLFLDDAKAPNCQKNNGFGDLGNYSEWPKVAGAVIQAFNRLCMQGQHDLEEPAQLRHRECRRFFPPDTLSSAREKNGPAS